MSPIVITPTPGERTFLELQTEFYARGFDYLNQDSAGRTRAKRWLNEAFIEDVCDPHPWPFLETSTTAVAPVSISDLRDVLYVVDQTNSNTLDFSDLRDVIDLDVNPGRAGAPNSFYFDGNTLSVYPTSSSAVLTVRYIKVPAELVDDNDVPEMPGRFHPLIVEGAIIRAYMDSDNYEAVAAVQARFDRRMERMVDSMFSRNLGGTQFVTATESSA